QTQKDIRRQPWWPFILSILIKLRGVGDLLILIIHKSRFKDIYIYIYIYIYILGLNSSTSLNLKYKKSIHP
ncbi:hypothetical protein K6L59_03770, partial [Candidatus Phytoplasma sp. Tabriz.2]|nr:hypothetical protein [Candidatus Phytoplasma australiense]